MPESYKTRVPSFMSAYSNLPAEFPDRSFQNWFRCPGIGYYFRKRPGKVVGNIEVTESVDDELNS